MTKEVFGLKGLPRYVSVEAIKINEYRIFKCGYARTIFDGVRENVLTVIITDLCMQDSKRLRIIIYGIIMRLK